jgi:spore coat polysaccharide biosynthesis protein SpsF
VVRLTGDCPLADPELIDRIVDFCLAGGFDYASNTLEPTFPDGLDAEVMRASVLAAASREARLPSQREHVTPFIYSHPQRFRLGSYRSTENRSHMRWTVDDIDDLELVDGIYRALYPTNPAFTTDDIVAYLAKHPGIASLNSRHHRNEGYARSLSRDPSGAHIKESPP